MKVRDLQKRPPRTLFPARISIMRFANCEINCMGSIRDLMSSLALLTVLEVSDENARCSNSSNSSSETAPICIGKKMKSL